MVSNFDFYKIYEKENILSDTLLSRYAILVICLMNCILIGKTYSSFRLYFNGVKEKHQVISIIKDYEQFGTSQGSTFIPISKIRINNINGEFIISSHSIKIGDEVFSLRSKNSNKVIVRVKNLTFLNVVFPNTVEGFISFSFLTLLSFVIPFYLWDRLRNYYLIISMILKDEFLTANKKSNKIVDIALNNSKAIIFSLNIILVIIAFFMILLLYSYCLLYSYTFKYYQIGLTCALGLFFIFFPILELMIQYYYFIRLRNIFKLIKNVIVLITLLLFIYSMFKYFHEIKLNNDIDAKSFFRRLLEIVLSFFS